MYRFICVPLTIVCLCSIAFGRKSKNDLVITLERTTCLGTCPAYKLTIRGDGSVIYKGTKFVRIVGHRRSKIEKATVAELLKAFIDTDYFALKDSYSSIQNPDGTETIVTDLPTTYSSLILKGRFKKIEDYVGALKQLEELEKRIDEVAGSKRWVMIDAATVHEEATHAWDVLSPKAQKLLLQAAEEGDAESITVLLQAGAKVNGPSPDGETPLVVAARSGNPAAVEVLLQAGADVNAKDNYGEDALKYAALGLQHQEELAKHPGPFEDLLPDYINNYKKIRELLIAAGAKEHPPDN
jgi:hypothetical protein